MAAIGHDENPYNFFEAFNARAVGWQAMTRAIES
jgi:hypothetical protein